MAITERMKLIAAIDMTSFHRASDVPLANTLIATIPAMSGAGRTKGMQASQKATSRAGCAPSRPPTRVRICVISADMFCTMSARGLRARGSGIGLHPASIGFMLSLGDTVSIDDCPDVDDPAQHYGPEEDTGDHHHDPFADLTIIHLTNATEQQ